MRVPDPYDPSLWTVALAKDPKCREIWEIQLVLLNFISNKSDLTQLIEFFWFSFKWIWSEVLVCSCCSIWSQALGNKTKTTNPFHLKSVGFMTALDSCVFSSMEDILFFSVDTGKEQEAPSVRVNATTCTGTGRDFSAFTKSSLWTLSSKQFLTPDFTYAFFLCISRFFLMCTLRVCVFLVGSIMEKRLGSTLLG